VADHDGEKQGLRQKFGQFSALQQRFEESSVGQGVISAFVAVVILIGVVWNLPDSPIKRSLGPVVAPAATAAYLNQSYALFAPGVPKRIETIEVQVTMADGAVRTWSPPYGDRAFGGFVTAHWMRLLKHAVDTPEVRPGIARWVAREVAGPDRAVAVAMVLRVQNLPPPGTHTRGATATKVIYQEQL
jgi:hypothetical protein